MNMIIDGLARRSIVTGGIEVLEDRRVSGKLVSQGMFPAVSLTVSLQQQVGHDRLFKIVEEDFRLLGFDVQMAGEHQSFDWDRWHLLVQSAPKASIKERFLVVLLHQKPTGGDGSFFSVTSCPLQAAA